MYEEDDVGLDCKHSCTTKENGRVSRNSHFSTPISPSVTLGLNICKVNLHGAQVKIKFRITDLGEPVSLRLEDGNIAWYEVCAMVLHEGGGASGHYVTYVRDDPNKDALVAANAPKPSYKGWWKIDNEEVTRCSMKVASSSLSLVSLRKAIDQPFTSLPTIDSAPVASPAGGSLSSSSSSSPSSRKRKAISLVAVPPPAADPSPSTPLLPCGGSLTAEEESHAADIYAIQQRMKKWQ
jgi:hypothetical protein